LPTPCNYVAVASTGKILFYNSLICKSDFIGCFASDLVFHAFHFAGTCFSTCSASCSLENALNTHAPEPVILAAP
jgi:predicted acyltransferase